MREITNNYKFRKHNMKQSGNTISRRIFLKSSTAILVAPHFIPCRLLGKNSPSHQVTLGIIGLGSMGLRHVKGFLQEKDCRIIAVCDVDANRRSQAINEIKQHYQNKDCVAYNDFRELIGRRDIDALCIAVPDHWHSIIAITGIRAGKDIYGEKPLALTIREGQDIVQEVNRYKCVWQTGSWQRSTAQFRFACELVRNGRIGRLQHVEVGIGEGFRPIGSKKPIYRIDPQPVMEIPLELDYEMWLGPAPWAPYTKLRCHWNFRWILDYSGGQVTDWGAHHIDIAQWGMDADDTGPVEVEGHGIFPQDGLWDAAVQYKFTCKYANGVEMVVGSNNHIQQGIKFIGSDGWVKVTRSKIESQPQSLIREKFGPNEIHLPKPTGDYRPGHRQNFLACVKTRARTISPVEVGHRSVTVAHLGNISMQLGRKIRWDPIREKIIDDDIACRILSKSMRSPWSY